MSEGFATYFTLLFREHAYGREDFLSGLRDSRDQVYRYYEKNPDYRVVHDEPVMRDLVDDDVATAHAALAGHRVILGNLLRG